ncbi:DUF4244 domain-containing protein [Arthrobacter sp. APC 3897]|uniref:DUF4244 domain-containing protein n=1 Tax=Arthrobacter sp. APC 3897 TaxID=3035204 RepID=UPI0025B4267D|nr:DUF4244 domain-containing protein [Arthrobacter sp. APC 3897]MDN3482642.1 DUF4244 domain-containing protein [Arthrobacter sp. APC 3897]
MPGLSRSVTTVRRARNYNDDSHKGAPHTGASNVQTDAPGVSAEHSPGAPASGHQPCGRGTGTVTVLYPRAPENASPVPQNRAERRRRSFYDREAGMATAEYAIATLAAVAFAALLVAVLGSGEVRSLLMGLIRSALTLG